MKRNIADWARRACVVLACLFFQGAHAGAPLALLAWGLEQQDVFSESSTTAEGNQTMDEHGPGQGKRYRYFRTSERYEEVSEAALARQRRLWERYTRAEPQPARRSARGFGAFAASRDPALVGMLRTLAPRLHFDFAGQSGSQYILEAITVQTLRFDPYAGGGFSDQEAWYDIVVPHEPGTVTYPVDDGKLRFTGSGRATLRLWSDRFDPWSGATPQGCFLVKLGFTFRVDGKRTVVSTPPFKVDL